RSTAPPASPTASAPTGSTTRAPTATARPTSPTSTAWRSRSGPPQAALDLAQAEPEQDRTAVGAVRAVVDAVHLLEEGSDLGLGEDISRAHDRVAGHGCERMVERFAHERLGACRRGAFDASLRRRRARGAGAFDASLRRR